jgi:hypothetical protein
LVLVIYYIWAEVSSLEKRLFACSAITVLNRRHEVFWDELIPNVKIPNPEIGENPKSKNPEFHPEFQFWEAALPLPAPRRLG